MSIKVIDNLISEEDFTKIFRTLMGEGFPWQYTHFKIYNGENRNDLKNFQFTHIFYNKESIQSDFFDMISPIIDKLDALSLIKVKANLTTRWEKIEEFDPHVDNNIEGSRSAIFYITNNDGYTRFIEEDKRVDSVSNRIVIFPTNTLHVGSTHTNTKTRILININYLPRTTDTL